MGWRAAKSLPKWHTQLQAKAPRTVKELPGSVWGLKAGGSHQQSGGHWPHHVDGLGDEIVTAADAPNAPELGLDIHAELDAIRRSHDGRVLYAISNDQMFSSYPAHGIPAWTWRPYNPTDPTRDKHGEHGHLQVVDDARADGEQPWATAAGADMNLTDTVNLPVDRYPGGGKTASVETILGYTNGRVVNLEADMGSVKAQAAANGSGISALSSQVAGLGVKVDNLASGGGVIDYDLLADKVADRLAARLAS